MNSKYLLPAVVALLLYSCTDPVPDPASVEKKDSMPQVESPKPVIATIERLDPALDNIILSSAKVETIAEGFKWSEGPLWLEAQQALIFSDIPNNIIFKWTAAKGKEVYLQPAGYTGSVARGGETGSNGLALNTKGQLILCQQGDRRIALMNAPLDAPKAEFITVADHYQGKKFDSPNDIIALSNGDYMFTDPPYGIADDSLKEAPYQGIYKTSANGTTVLLTDTITRPNGIAIFPGEKSILIGNSDSDKAIWYKYDLNDKHEFVNPRIFYNATAEGRSDKGSPDGLKIDSRGNVYASGPGGLWIFDKNAKILGKIKINQSVSNCALSANEKTLFITADYYVLKVDMR
ncbi:MAG: SMP-30/gluconolactonase/LRE family protein [Flavitalea sp.]